MRDLTQRQIAARGRTGAARHQAVVLGATRDLDGRQRGRLGGLGRLRRARLGPGQQKQMKSDGKNPGRCASGAGLEDRERGPVV